jgi:RimJ/RimL family protein N-acetyltransferase
MPGHKLLKGQLVYLDTLQSHDKSYLYKWRCDISLERLTGPFNYLPISFTQINIDSNLQHVMFAVRTLKDRVLIGEISLQNIMWPNRNAELGVMIGDANYQGKGYGSEAIYLLIDYAFNELNLHRVQLNVVAYNERAIAAYKKIGFQSEGTYREYGCRDGKFYDLHLMGLLSKEWDPQALFEHTNKKEAK